MIPLTSLGVLDAGLTQPVQMCRLQIDSVAECIYTMPLDLSGNTDKFQSPYVLFSLTRDAGRPWT
jgi:hypothetical protein